MNEIDIHKDQLILKRKKNKSRKEQQNLTKKYLKLTEEAAQHTIRKQPGSKLVFKWATNDKGQQVQVNYDAYELREHEAAYRSILEIANELEEYADKRDGEDGYDEAVQEARTLTTEIKVEAHKYFNSIDKTELKTNEFKRNCNLHITKTNKVLANHRDPLWKCIIGKLSLAIVSVVGLSAPYFLHKHSMKKKFIFSTELF